MTYIIAEIGLNHNGSMEKAVEMITEAKRCGADCAKFQFFVEKEVPEVWELVKDKAFDIGTLRLLRNYCREVDIDFLCSVFGMHSATHLSHYMPDLHSVKIPSGALPNTELREFCAYRFNEVYASTGMHSINELINYKMPEKWNILHCVSAYPVPDEETNLDSIPYLKGYFWKVGFSDHSRSKRWKGHLAVAAGALVIERHFNLEDNPCVDEIVSDTPRYFMNMCKTIRDVEEVMGWRKKECMHSETENLHRKFKTE